ncbi:glycosyl transferase [Chondromyces crocatus]|uniref:Glycosyl transferase n=1 Tax=Chondromyces crocatus TaxID=52 RepID=A0A0K1E981_CHOCO|nr:glycosyl transferase [Chondromyces crocatus]
MQHADERNLLSSAAVTVDLPFAETQKSLEPLLSSASASPAPLATTTPEQSPVLAEGGAPHVSIVVPGLNEAESLPELASRIKDALGGRVVYELIFVDDGSTDDTWKVIGAIRAKDPTVKGIRLRKNFGKATALTAGFQKARGEIIVTMDADLQDDPADLPTLLGRVEAGDDVVVGWKVQRLDPTNRLVLSRIFNGTVRWVTGVKLHDMNCGFKAYRQDVIRNIPIYGDLFRFIPALAASQGFRVAEVPVKHHARRYGASRYGLERILRGFFDLLSVLFLTRYSKKPMHLFGLMGLVFAALGVCVNAYLTLLWFLGHKIGDRPLLLLGVLMIILGIQFFSMGFIGEFLTFQMQQRTMRNDLPIREEVG